MMSNQLRVRPGLRVLQVIYHDPVNYPPTLNAMRVLAQAGAQVLCLGYDRGLSAPVRLPESARIEYLNASAPGYPPSTLGIWLEGIGLRSHAARAIRAFRPDLVIGYDHWGSLALLPICVRDKVIKISHLHDIVDAKSLRTFATDRLMWAALRRVLPKFALVVVPESARADFLRDRHEIRYDILTVGNSPPREEPGRNDELRRQLTGVGNDPIAVVVGMMALGNETVRALARTRKRWHVVVVGCRKQAWLDSVRSEAVRCNVADRLHLLPYTDYDTVRRWLPGCDVGLGFYANSHNPNWRYMGAGSVKIQEYMAAGIPTLAGMRGSLGRLAEDTGALAIIDQASDSAIAAELDSLEPGSERWQRLASAATKAHLGSYNMEAQLAPLLVRLRLDR